MRSDGILIILGNIDLMNNLFQRREVLLDRLIHKNIAVSKVKHTLPTLKFRCIAIGAYLVSTGRQKKLMLAVSGSKRDYIDSLFQKIKKYKPQLKQSTA